MTPQPSLARRVSSWTSNLLATGIVLAAAIGVGRQLVQWWQIDAAANSNNAAPAPGPAPGEADQQPFEVSFNGQYALRRIEFHGDSAAATKRLQDECRRILQSGRLPTAPPSSGEQRFLARAADRPPLEEQPGEWQIHQFDGKLPLLVAIAVESHSPVRGAGGQQPSGLHHARVLAWGLAMPTDEEACTLLVYEAGGSGAAEDSLPRGEIELPTGWSRSLTLRGSGETSVGIRVNAPPRRATSELDAFFSSRGWTPSAWRQLPGAWHARYRSSNNAAATIDVQLSEHPRGGSTGLLILSHPES